jgi:hypothetical protein
MQLCHSCSAERLVGRDKVLYKAAEKSYSPDGPVRVVPSLTGVPKLGVLFEFQLTFCTMVYLLPSHAPLLLAVA